MWGRSRNWHSVLPKVWAGAGRRASGANFAQHGIGHGRKRCGIVVLRTRLGHRDHLFADRQAALCTISRRAVHRCIRRAARHQHHYWDHVWGGFHDDGGIWRFRNGGGVVWLGQPARIHSLDPPHGESLPGGKVSSACGGRNRAELCRQVDSFWVWALLRCGLRAPAGLSRERGLYFTLQPVGACEKFEAAAGSDPVLEPLGIGCRTLAVPRVRVFSPSIRVFRRPIPIRSSFEGGWSREEKPAPFTKTVKGAAPFTKTVKGAAPASQ